MRKKNVEKKAEKMTLRLDDKIYVPRYLKKIDVRIIAELTVIEVYSWGIIFEAQGSRGRLDNNTYQKELGKSIFSNKKAAAYKLAIMILEEALREEISN